MAAATPSKSNKDVMAFNYPRTLMPPISHSAIRATLDYNLSAIGKILMARDGRSAAERMDYVRKNLDSFKKPAPLVPLRDKKDEDDDEEEEDEEEELMGDEKRSASDAELEVPSEGEQECKKAKIISKL